MTNEKRLIDADDAEKALLEFRKGHRRTDERCAISGCILEIRELPTVDAVEVVRCKDCKKISPSVTPIKDSVWCREFRAYMPCDGFCSYGERREGE